MEDVGRAALEELEGLVHDLGGGVRAAVHDSRPVDRHGLVRVALLQEGQMPLQLVPAVLFGALLAGAELFHCVLDSLFMLGGLLAGADYGLGAAVGALAWALLGNVVGGVGLVTGLRLLRVPKRVEEERRRPG